MIRWRGALPALWVTSTIVLSGAPQDAAPAGLLDRIQARMKENLERLPDYACQQTVKRLRRGSQTREFEPVDTLRLDVGLSGNKEMFAWRDARRFEDKELADMIGSGTVGTGNFGLHAKNVFLTGTPDFTYRGEEQFQNRRAIRFEYDVPRERSRYRIRIPPDEAMVGFHGSFWVDAESLDLLRLEVRAEDIPERLRLLRSSDVMDYARTRIGQGEFLLPKSSELTMAGIHGDESRNLTEFSACRQYASESKLSFDDADATAARAPGSLELPPRLVLELSLDTEIAPESAAIGDAVRAVLTRPLQSEGRVLAPQGTKVLGRLVRIEKQALPLEHYVVALQFHTLEMPGARAEFSATMEDAGPSSGLIRQEKRLDPTFTRQRVNRLNILVREHPRGQGVLHWEAKRPTIGRGLRMKWVTD